MANFDWSKRDALKAFAAVASAPVLGLPAHAAPIPPLEPDQIEALIEQKFGSIEPKPGPVTLKIPALSESGNSVPLTVIVDSASENAVDHVLVVATRNRRPMVMDVQFANGIPKAQISTRIRLNETQTLLAFAKLHTGEVWKAQTNVEVVIGACEGLGFTY